MQLSPKVVEHNRVITKSWLSRDWRLRLVGALAIVGAVGVVGEHAAIAQIRPDNTLGTESTQVRATGSGAFQIDGGATRGANLFHSFSQFSVPTNGVAAFNNAVIIQNIISRVTGGSVSNIDGLLKAKGTANLFLINPNGILFGRHARVNIGGSFLASTASSLKFADGTQFSATSPQTTPLLTISVPIGLQFGANPGSIGNLSQVTDSIGNTVGSQVVTGKTLALVGGDIFLEGATLNIVGGRIELGSVAGPGLVSLNPTTFALGYDSVPTFGDIQLSQQAIINATVYNDLGGGDIQIRGRRVVITDGSQIRATVLGSGSEGRLNINASDSVELSNSSGVFTEVNPGATGGGGNLIVNTGQLIVQDGAQVSAVSRGQGNAGNIQVNANSVDLSGVGLNGFSTGLFTGTSGVGQAGTITVNSSNFRVADGAVVSALTTDKGNGGDITVNANIFEADNGGQVVTTTRGSGRAGNIRLNVPNSVILSGSDPTYASRLANFGSNTVTNEGAASGLFASTDANSKGNGGNIFIDPMQLTIAKGSSVSVNSLGKGNAGNVTAAANSIFLDQGQLTAISAAGKGGNIQLGVSDLLLLRSNSLISAVSGTVGNNGLDGNINIGTKLLVAVTSENSDIIATGLGRSIGSNIQVNAQGIFGIQYQKQQTPESDIVATGTVKFNALQVDPRSGLVAFPAVVLDNSRLIVPGCQARGGKPTSRFVNTGHGGLPPNPYEALDSSEVWRDVQLPRKLAENLDAVSRTSTSPTMNPDRFVEAQGWIVNKDGNVELVAKMPTAISQERCDLR